MKHLIFIVIFAIVQPAQAQRINTKSALVKFQKDNGLSIGSLDLQTLKALGVSVNGNTF